jgi:F-box domain
MEPRFLTLSVEILVEILAILQPRDIIACKLTCRMLRDVIDHSSLIQYIVQAFLAGVHDPLIPGASIAERSTALQCLENAWHDLDVRKRTAHITHGTAWPWLNYIIHDDYLLAIRGDSDNPAQPPGYSYIDLRQSPSFTNLLWTRVDVAWHGQHCVFAFAAEENDLAVVVTYVRLPFDWRLARS